MLRELRDGDVLGDHTFTHPDLTAGRQRTRTAAAHDRRDPLAHRLHAVRVPPALRRLRRQRPADGRARSGWRRCCGTSIPPTGPSPPPRRSSRACSSRCSRGRSSSPTTAAGRAGTRWPPTRGSSRPCARRGLRIVTIPELLGYRPVYVHCLKLCDGLGRAPLEAAPQRARSSGPRAGRPARKRRFSCSRPRPGVRRIRSPGGFAGAGQQHRAPVAQWSTGLFGVPKSSGLSSRRPRVRFPPGAFCEVSRHRRRMSRDIEQVASGS